MTLYQNPTRTTSAYSTQTSVLARGNPESSSLDRALNPRYLAQRLAPATCGELMQGNIAGQDFLVNCPIERYAKVAVYAAKEPGFRLQKSHHFSIVKAALDLLEDKIEHSDHRGKNLVQLTTLGRELRIDSDIPRGKGMASSSADIAAALTVACDILHYTLSPRLISEIVAQVEPSDHVHLPGISQVDHLGGSVLDSLPTPADLSVIVVDCGGEVNTEKFDREHARAVYKEQQYQLICALEGLKRGLKQQDVSSIAREATISARINQKILPKAPFEQLLACTGVHGALGLNCAHSGTVLGVLHRSSDNIAHKLWWQIENDFGESVEILGSYRIISGGCRAC